MNSSIWSEEQVLKFYNEILQDLTPNTTDFFCIAARKKYMTEEQRQNTSLGNTCMMSKTILKEHDEHKFLAKLHQVDASMDWFTDTDDLYIPRECMAFYINVNHTDVLKAIKDFKKLMVDWDYDVASLTTFSNNTKQEMVGKQLKTVQNNLLKSFQDPKNTVRKWTDIDCDTDVEVNCEHIKLLINGILEWEIPEGHTHVVKTHGGYHVLIDNNDLSEYNRNLASKTENKKMLKDLIIDAESIVKTLKNFFGEENAKEIKINQNMSIPLPGTIQGGFKVYMV